MENIKVERRLKALQFGQIIVQKGSFNYNTKFK